jgi:hypothetical protein
MWIWSLVELYVALLAASAPALKPFVRRYLVDPMTSGSNRSGHRRNYAGRYARDVEMDSKGYAKEVFEDDPERIGVAYGGSDTMKSREESFIREVDDGDLETKHYELRKSSGSKKTMPTQVWKKSRTSTRDGDYPVTPNDMIDAQQHVRNFSSPHYHKSSGDTTSSLLSHSKKPMVSQQLHEEQRLSDPHALGQTHVLHRLSEGSVKAGRIRAQQIQSKSPSIGSGSTAVGHHRAGPGRMPPPVYQSHNQFTSHQRKLSAQREREARKLEPQHYLNGADPEPALGGRSPSQNRMELASEASDSGNSFDEPHNRPDMYSPGMGELDHSRSTSEDTLHLPRMGSKDDMAAQARREKEAERRRRELELEMYKRREEEKERERERTREGEMDMYRQRDEELERELERERIAELEMQRAEDLSRGREDRKREWRKEGTVKR